MERDLRICLRCSNSQALHGNTQYNGPVTGRYYLGLEVFLHQTRTLVPRTRRIVLTNHKAPSPEPLLSHSPRGPGAESEEQSDRERGRLFRLFKALSVCCPIPPI